MMEMKISELSEGIMSVKLTAPRAPSSLVAPTSLRDMKALSLLAQFILRACLFAWNCITSTTLRNEEWEVC